jgi:hypothetical protein
MWIWQVLGGQVLSERESGVEESAAVRRRHGSAGAGLDFTPTPARSRSPAHAGATVKTPVTIAAWAIDPNAPTGRRERDSQLRDLRSAAARSPGSGSMEGARPAVASRDAAGRRRRPVARHRENHQDLGSEELIAIAGDAGAKRWHRPRYRKPVLGRRRPGGVHGARSAADPPRFT